MATLTGKILADFTTSLATALAVGATTATLQSATDDDGVALPSGRYYFTLDGSNSSKEHIRCDLSGTALTNIYSVSRQGVATSGTVRAHRLGATVTLTDFAHIKVINDLVNGTTALDSTSPLKYDGTPTFTYGQKELVTWDKSKDYTDSVAIAGAPDASTTTKGIVKMSTAPVSATSPIAVGDNDTRVPTQGENDALVGTAGTPSSTNKYVTNDDTTGTGNIIRQSYIDGIEWFGDGSDGDVTISADTTLSRDMFYNNLTINTGKFLYANGYRIFVKGILTTLGTGKIDRSGNNGANGVGSAPPGPKINAAGGAALPAGTLTGVSAGGQGGGADYGNSFEAGSAASSVTNSIGVVGGAGGGPRPTGTVTAASPSIHAPYPVYLLDTTAILMRNTTGQFNGSSSGAGGDSSQGNGGTRGGGGGGSSGGIIFIAAKEMNFAANDSVRAIGGNGGTGATSGLGNAFGGGGGSGGVIVLLYRTMSGTTLTAATALAAGSGGAGGGGGNGGGPGSNGTTGVIYSYQV